MTCNFSLNAVGFPTLIYQLKLYNIKSHETSSTKSPLEAEVTGTLVKTISPNCRVQVLTRQNYKIVSVSDVCVCPFAIQKQRCCSRNECGSLGLCLLWAETVQTDNTTLHVLMTSQLYAASPSYAMKRKRTEQHFYV